MLFKRSHLEKTLSRSGDGPDISLCISFDTQQHGKRQTVFGFFTLFINKQHLTFGIFGDLRLYPFIEGIILINCFIDFIDNAAHFHSLSQLQSAAQEGRGVQIDRFHAIALFRDPAGGIFDPAQTERLHNGVKGSFRSR